MSYSSANDYFKVRGKMLIWDREKKQTREATCSDCGWAKSYTVYDEWELRKIGYNKVRCLLQNCAKECDDMACVDFVKVS